MTHPQTQPATVDPAFLRTFGDSIEWVTGTDEDPPQINQTYTGPVEQKTITS